MKRSFRPSVLKIIYIGTPDFSASVLEKLIPVFDVQAVITNPDALIGRDQRLTPTPVAKLAKKHSIPVLKPEIIDQEFINKNLGLLKADLFVVFAYGKILPVNLLKIPTHGSVNIHTSLLPKYRGTAPIQSAILNGDSETGVSLILMDEKMDHGPIIKQQVLALTPEDTLESVTQKLSQIGANLVVETLPAVADGSIDLQTQDESLATYTWKKSESKQQAFFDIQNPPSVEKLDQMSRAFYPWPNAWTNWNGKVVKFYPEKKIQMEGKKIVSWEEFLRGYPEFPRVN